VSTSAAAGRRIIVTVGGLPTVVLGPIDDRGGKVTIVALVAAGALVPPRRLGIACLCAPIVMWSGRRLDRAFAEVRG
jgi:hypothetical protein